MKKICGHKSPERRLFLEKIQKNHSTTNFIGDPFALRITRRIISATIYLWSNPRTFDKDKFTSILMQGELYILKNDVWELVLRPSKVNGIGTKWVYKNKSDENGNNTCNKAILVARDILRLKVLTWMKRLFMLLILRQ